MWTITAVTVDNGPHSYVVFGGLAGKEIVGPSAPFGPAGSRYVISFPGLGYITLEDVGNSVPGGDWSVHVSGSSTNWFYGGGGQASIAIQSATGKYTISGGANTITGQLTKFF